jgi:hypothetical protein
MIICSDDYGLREDIDRAILELCESRRLTAISCMTLLEGCTAAGMSRLLSFASSTDIGLHLCFTDENQPLSGGSHRRFPTYGRLLRRSLFRKLDAQEIAREISQQYELFKEKSGRRPDFIDGHLHTHQLPVIRETLITFALTLPAAERPYIRNTQMDMRGLRENQLPRVKAGLIGRFGARMARLLHDAGLASNDGFAGIYDFKKYHEYPRYFPRFLKCLEKSSGILVVHPGRNEQWRRQEFAVLQDYAFAPNELNRFNS